MRDFGRNVQVGHALLAFVLTACGGSSPAEPEPVCTTYIVSALTGDTVAIENYQGPPSPDSLFHVSEWWTEGCEEEDDG